ncbi:MAG: serine hydrolase domain-containing protein [Candidatus Hodarchaeota archaeon]
MKLPPPLQRFRFTKTVISLLFLIIIPSTILFTFVMVTERPSSWLTDDWNTSPLDHHGMDSQLLTDMYSYIEEQVHHMHSLMIVRNGFIVAEQYFNGWNQKLEHELYSCTKSITSILMGIALDKGFISNIDQYILDFFPNRNFENMDSRKKNITIRHLLQMKSGIAWNEWNISYENPNNPVRQLMVSNDWVAYVLDLPMVSEPGKTFTYNTGVSHLLSAIIQQSVNMTTLSFAQKYLFGPLNINSIRWTHSSHNVVFGGAGLSLSPRDMAKIGYLCLNNGTWQSQQIVSSEWIQQSTQEYFHLWRDVYYGYQWWILPTASDYFIFTASGYRGQWITCIPDLDLVVVFTADTDVIFYRTLLTKYIIPAVIDNLTFIHQLGI